MSQPVQSIQIPLFPLPVVVFPGEALPLHVFEDRYKEMLQFCLATTPPRLIGINLVSEGKEITPIGCAVRIDRIVNQYPDGRVDVLTVGTERYELERMVRTKTFAEGMVRFLPDSRATEPIKNQQKAIALHGKLLELVKGSPPTHNFSEDAAVSYALAHDAGLEMQDRQALLELRAEQERIDFLIEYFHRILPTVLEREELQERIRANGYFRKFLSPL